jgi:hypothetical protein
MPDETNQEVPVYPRRATRFPIQTSVYYRESGEIAWHKGTTVNISRSGVLFQAEGDLVPQTMLEMRIVFPFEITGDVSANVICWGPVVRNAQLASVEGQASLAAAILRYRFLHD